MNKMSGRSDVLETMGPSLDGADDQDAAFKDGGATVTVRFSEAEMREIDAYVASRQLDPGEEPPDCWVGCPACNGPGCLHCDGSGRMHP